MAWIACPMARKDDMNRLIPIFALFGLAACGGIEADGDLNSDSPVVSPDTPGVDQDILAWDPVDGGAEAQPDMVDPPDPVSEATDTSPYDDEALPYDVNPEDGGPGQPPDEGPEDIPVAPIDLDNDGMPDDNDNCPYDKNPGQENLDGDEFGDLCDEDMDGDGIPNESDLWPLDPDLPGKALENTVYAHSSGVLHSMDAKTFQLTSIGSFTWPPDGGGHQMTDVALDRYGVLYGVTFDRLYTCHPQTAVCKTLGELPKSFNALTLVPKGTVLPNSDALIGIANDGGWYHLDFTTTLVQALNLGSYGYPYDSSGDAFSIETVGTFATVDKVGQTWDVLVKVDTTTGKVLGEIATLTGYSHVYGLAGWGKDAFIFDESGDILVVNVVTGLTEVIAETNISWWGAGVTTRM